MTPVARAVDGFEGDLVAEGFHDGAADVRAIDNDVVEFG